MIPHVVYVDSQKKADSFFKDANTLLYINARKTYEKDADVQFMFKDFTSGLDLPENSFDLLISQYAGFVSRFCKVYLSIGGILVANNSHGDASMAFLDPDYKLIGIVNNCDHQYVFDDQDLDGYFKPKRGSQVT